MDPMTLVAAPAAARLPAPRARLEGVVLVALALVINSLAARFISQPGYTDAYYYFGGARQLANGQGFTEPYLWNYLAPPRAVDPGQPVWPSHLYWMPLVSLVAAPAMAVAQRLAGGVLPNAVLFRAAQLPFILLASALPLLSYGVAQLVGGTRRQASAAALLTLFSPFYFVYWTTTDAFALYALTAAGALVLTAQAGKHPTQASRWLWGAGLAAGLAHLTRADGILLLICLLLWVVVRPISGPGWRPRLVSVAALLVGYALVMAPWFWRNSVVAGTPLGLGGTRTIWLTTYDDLFTFSPERLTPAAYLAAGAGSILGGKWSAFLDNAQTVLAVQGGLVAFPFAVVGMWRLRRAALIQLAAGYGVALFAAMTVVFTLPGARGGYFHSGAALMPFFMVSAAVGLEATVEGIARHLPHWQPERSKPIFTRLLIAFAVVLTGLVFWRRVIGPDPSQTAWQASEHEYAQAGAWLVAHGQGGVVVAVNDPPGWNYWTTGPAIVIPNGDATTVSQAMSAYGARLVVLGANRPSALSALYADPHSQSMFVLRARFTDPAGQPTYLLELVPEP